MSIGLVHTLNPRVIKELVQDHVPERESQILIPVYFEGLQENGTANGDANNKFNDLAVLWNNKDSEIIGVWRVTTEPGCFWKQPGRQLTKKGWGIIAFGYYKAWLVGRHKTRTSNQFPALIQSGGEVTVMRNRNPQGNRRTGTIDRGYFGFNVHTVANNDSDRTLDPGELAYEVGAWSGGCTVFQNAEQFYNEFMPYAPKFYGSDTPANKVKPVGQLYLAEDEYIEAEQAL